MSVNQYDAIVIGGAVVIAAAFVSSFIGRRLVLQVYASTLRPWLQLRRYS